eukprot:1341642-Amorphochlora_amoeboformis.AAC.1
MADGSDRDLLKPAFAVHGEPNFDRGPPADAMEYLRRVRYEAQRLPQKGDVPLSGGCMGGLRMEGVGESFMFPDGRVVDQKSSSDGVLGADTKSRA